MRRIILVVLLAYLSASGVLLAQAGCPSGTCTVTGCELADVQTAYNTAINGDVIQLGAGTCTWSSGLVISKAITIQGQGPNSTILYPNQSLEPFLMQWSTTSGGNGTYKIAHLAMDTGNGPSGYSGMVRVYGNTRNFVVQNVRYELRRGANSFFIAGDVRGVLQFSLARTHIFSNILTVWHSNWGGAGNYGDNAWASAHTFGDPQGAIYVENSTIQCAFASYCTVSDMKAGARVVVRFSKTIVGQWVMHGEDSSGRLGRGTMAVEYYRNTFEGQQGYHPLPIRSGTGFVFDNVGTSVSPAITIYDFYRGRDDTNVWGQPPWSPFSDCRIREVTAISCNANVATITGPFLTFDAGSWIKIRSNSVGAYNGTWAVLSPPIGTYGNSGYAHGHTSITAAVSSCGGTGSGGIASSPYDGGTATSVGAVDYPCWGGVGRGPGATMLTGDYSTSTPALTIANDQVLAPIYDFNNINGGVAEGAQVNATATVANRDYFSQVGGSCVSGGACTSGVGRGTTLPATCTANAGGVTNANVGFWKTDDSGGDWNQETSEQHALHDPGSVTHTAGQDGRFYRCNSTNTWTVHYTPAPFPHPLLSGTTPPNGNPTVTITSPANYANTGTSTQTFTGTCVDAETACNQPTYACSPACGSGTTDGTPTNWNLSASAPLGVSTWTITGSDGTLTGSASGYVLRRATVSVLPMTDDCSSSVAWPNLGPHYTHYGSTPTYAGMASGLCAVTAAAFDGYAFTGFSLNTNHYIKATIGTVSPFAQQLRLCVNMKGSAGQTDNLSGLWIQVDGTNSASNIMARYVGGALDHVYVSGAQMGAITVVPGTTTVEARRWDDTLTLLVDGVAKAVADVSDTVNGVDPTLFDGGTAGPCPYGVGTTWDNVEIGNVAPPPSDVTDPVVTILVPDTGSEVADVVTELSGTATDDVAVASCTRDNDRLPGEVSITTGAGTFTASNVPVSPGVNTLTIRCLDAAGNTGTDTVQVIRISSSPPRLKRRPF